MLAQSVSSHAAPQFENLVPSRVTNPGKHTVIISNPETINGVAKLLALRADVDENRVSKVVFEVSRDGKFGYSHTENDYPYCLFGNNGSLCRYLLAGDETPEKYVLKTGKYSITVTVFGAASLSPEWSGVVTFTLVPGDLTHTNLPYGTGSGNGPYVRIIDPHWRPEGMKNIQIEARLLNGTKDKYIKTVRFDVTPYGSDRSVYVGTETRWPYCIFGELDDRKSCKTMRVGDVWPKSYEPKFISNEQGYGKEERKDIQQTTIKAGRYNLIIFVSTNFGTWRSDGDFILQE
jgi:hypothetical protein